ncbi:MAG TPA: hypothetical protein VFE14_14210 [Micromonosporaceae bacterium]|nr:hypothetical protein [Micromonosporaceae bacterium]
MLLPRRVLDGIATGEITRAYRRWERPRVLAGTSRRTAIGLVAVDAIDEVDPAGLADADARQAGYPDADALVADLNRYGTGRVYRIALRYAGPDPRIALRERADLDEAEVAMLRSRLARLDQASRRGPWTVQVLRLIAERPAVRAPDLAASLGRETRPFKVDVRKLKELGLTESLEIGYRLSARGEVLLSQLDAGTS